MKKMNRQIAGFGIVMGALVACTGVQQAQAAATDTTALTMQVNDAVSISATPSLTVTPVLADFQTGKNYVTETGGIELLIDSTSGSKITWTATANMDVTAGIRNADITLASTGAFVAGDGTTALYSSTEPESALEVPIDVKISNIKDYALGGHTSTLTFTIVSN